MDDKELEHFVKDWVASRVLEYRQWQRWGQTGDLGRDVVGYVTDHRHEGPWDKVVDQFQLCGLGDLPLRWLLHLDDACVVHAGPGSIPS